MNKQDLMRTRNDAMREIRFTNKTGSHRNCLRLSTANTKEHEFKKFEICWELLKEGKQFITEAIFDNGSRADIVVLDDHKVIEILHSEKELDCERKFEKYPALFVLEMVRVNK